MRRARLGSFNYSLPASGARESIFHLSASAFLSSLPRSVFGSAEALSTMRFGALKAGSAAAQYCKMSLASMRAPGRATT